MWDIPLNQPTPMFGKPQVSHLADVFGLLARPAKGFAALTGMASPDVAPWLPRKSIIPEKYNYPYGTPPREIEADQHAKMGEQFLGGVGNITKVAPMMGIRAFHGSPHDFDRFDMSKIGTGEGAQAYGHGLYFAEKEGVAKAYRDALGPLQGRGYSQRDRMRIQMGDKKLELTSEPQVRAWRSLNSAGGWGNVQDAFANARRMRADDPDALRWIDRWEKQGARAVEDNGGRMYEVNLRAKPEEFLDWDKPLRESSAPVRDALNRVANSRPPEVKDKLWSTVNEPGSMFYSALNDAARTGDLVKNQTAATNALRDAGIPGIKYFDQGSRATGGGHIMGVEKTPEGMFRSKIRVDNRGGMQFQDPTSSITWSMPFKTEAEALSWAQGKVNEGSRNYVLFRDDIIDIVRKYGMIPPMFGKRDEK
jgi:hypothetical protein